MEFIPRWPSLDHQAEAAKIWRTTFSSRVFRFQFGCKLGRWIGLRLEIYFQQACFHSRFGIGPDCSATTVLVTFLENWKAIWKSREWLILGEPRIIQWPRERSNVTIDPWRISSNFRTITSPGNWSRSSQGSSIITTTNDTTKRWTTWLRLMFILEGNVKSWQKEIR